MKTKKTNIIKKQGTKTLAGILAVGMTFGTPISVLADDNISDSTMEQQAGVQNVLAKKVDGSETLVKVSEVVLGMIQRNEVKLDTDKFLKDVTTGQKVDPTTGERVTELGTPVEPSKPEIPTTPTEPSEPEIPETPAEPSEPEAPTTPSEPNEPETPADNIENTETDQNGQANQEEAVQTENTETASNEDLISRQQIVKLPQIIDDFRFWTVARTYAFAKDNLYVRESIPEGIDGTADTSDESLKADKKAAKKEAKKLNAIYEKAEQNKKAAIHAEPITEQQQTEDDVTLNENVTDQNAEQVRYIGKLDKNGLLYILKEEENGWLYVESADVRGFVARQYLNTGDEVTTQVEITGEDHYQTAEEIISPEENQALYYTLTSTKEGTPNGAVRESILEYASQFIGNPYVWGGTSLTEGADCSGFVQQIYKAYGYELPRVAQDQSQYGTQIPVEDAQPGDLIFYAKAGHVYHVVMYAGDGKTIEAANTKAGIISGTVNTENAVWATRILEDNEVVVDGGIGEVNATTDMYGTCLGNFKITYYCACEKCCNKADGITATGSRVAEGRTIAVDPSVIPYGTKVIIGGHIFTAEDCGGAIKQNHIDIYVNSHEEAEALGVANASVYLVK